MAKIEKSGRLTIPSNNVKHSVLQIALTADKAWLDFQEQIDVENRVYLIIP